MQNRIVFVTNNEYKIKEIGALTHNQIVISSLSDIGFIEDIPETENTIEGNARLKASHIYNLYQIDCFADDTGLEVDALNGQPGVFSARYAGEPFNADNNIQKLLMEMNGVKNRKARFRTVIALYMDNNLHYFEGVINGSITHDKRGNEGFGYDPVFIPDGYDCTFAEMTLTDKNRISHRAIAVEKLVGFLIDHFKL